MAVVKCNKCGQKASTSIGYCSNCGSPVKKNIGCLWVAVIFFVFPAFYYSLIANNDRSTSATRSYKPPIEIQKSPEEIKAKRIKDLVRQVDYRIEKTIKKSMNDPDSYKEEVTNYWDMGDHVVIKKQFREKNAFGGVVRNTAVAKIDDSGNVTSFGIEP